MFFWLAESEIVKTHPDNIKEKLALQTVGKYHQPQSGRCNRK